MTLILLAGGENRRIPFNKSLIAVGGVCMIDRIMEVHKRIFNDKILISTNSPEIYFRYGLKMVGDILDFRGAMTGIFSVMVNEDDEWFFVTACDMPYVKEELVRYIISTDKKADAVIPVYNGEPQPLLGMYNRSLTGRLYGNIKRDRRSMRAFLREINTYFIDEETVRAIDERGCSFININTLDDLNKIQGGCICSD
ncbi:molybdenum cofactor guanylyltransferase [bacterium BMS3Bbin05]|nr:molybdenum cofactor guanylyltransferase [bacterium BMS3Bbin05]